MKTEEVADVCLLLEGTYPYVPGGVSAWVDQLLRGLPQLKFCLVYIGSKRGLTGKAFYQLPENVTSLTEIYIYDISRLLFCRNRGGTSGPFLGSFEPT